VGDGCAVGGGGWVSAGVGEAVAEGAEGWAVGTGEGREAATGDGKGEAAGAVGVGATLGVNSGCTRGSGEGVRGGSTVAASVASIWEPTVALAGSPRAGTLASGPVGKAVGDTGALAQQLRTASSESESNAARTRNPVFHRPHGPGRSPLCEPSIPPLYHVCDSAQVGSHGGAPWGSNLS